MTGGARPPSSGTRSARWTRAHRPGRGRRPPRRAPPPRRPFASARPDAAPVPRRLPAGPPAAPPRTRRQRFRAWRFAPIVEVIGDDRARAGARRGRAGRGRQAVRDPVAVDGADARDRASACSSTASPTTSARRSAATSSSSTRRARRAARSPSPTSEPCPQSDATPASDYYVKRVIGLPGDRIAIRGGHPVINGRVLTNEPYIDACGGAPECNMPRAIVVPEGRVLHDGRQSRRLG